MAGVFGYSREAVRVKVQKCEGMLQPEYRKFSVDPQITSFEVLQSIIAKAFDIKGEFTVSYRAIDDYGQETYLSLLSDWDLDAAFLSASEPCLGLQIEAKPFQESSEEWDEGIPADIDVMPSIRGLEALRLPQLQMQQLQGGSNHVDRCGTQHNLQQQMQQQQPHQPQTKVQHRLPGLILNQVERTFNMVQRALNLGEESASAPVSTLPPRPPLTDAEFRMFLDPIGQVVQDRELRGVIYYGGIEPSLRKVVWKHILNVYPEGMSGKERMDYMKKKAHEYNSLRDCWRDMIQKGQVTSDLSYVTSMVRKDVLRTDRHHPFYAGSDDNQNIASLFNILTTYALNHPTVSYCQGMSDLASPLLVTMGDEAHAYICFCALMRRLRPNFMLDGEAMTLRFQHLSDGLMYYDPEFYSYLKSHQADDLLFCYRWLLLEMKREFAFDDALRMMEVMWSSLPPSAHTGLCPNSELPLFDTQFTAPPSGHTPPPISPLLKTPRENAYTKVCALRRQGSAASLVSRNKQFCRSSTQRQNQSLDETVSGRVIPPKVKPFSSLDDAFLTRSLSLTTAPGDSATSSSSIGFMNKSEENCEPRVQHSPKSPRSPRSPNAGNIILQRGSSVKKHFKEKFQPSRCKSLFLSLEKLDRQHGAIQEESQEKKQENTRVVKNLNEFLNFSNLNRSSLMSPRKKKPSVTKQAHVGSVDETVDSHSESSVMRPSGNNYSHNHCEYARSSSTSTMDRSTSDDSSPDDSEYYPVTTSMTRELRLELDSLDRQVFGPSCNRLRHMSDDTEDTESACSESGRLEPDSDTTQSHHGSDHISTAPQANNDDVFLWENPLKGSPTTPDEQADLEFDGHRSRDHLDSKTLSLKSSSPVSILSNKVNEHAASMQCADSSKGGPDGVHCQNQSKTTVLGKKCESSIEPEVVVTSNTNCEEAIELNCSKPLPTGVHTSRLPPPNEFGGGNPFLMFLCLTVLRQHRDFIIRNNMDYNEVAMHFDKMVRKHDVTRVLNQARSMFATYLKQYNNNNHSSGVGSSHGRSSQGSSGLSV